VFRNITILRTPTELIPGAIIPSKSVIVPGDTFSVRFSVLNSASAPGADEPPDWKTGVYFSPNDSVLDGSDLLVSTYNESRTIKQGGKADVVVPVHVPANAVAGSHWMIVHLDTLSPVPRSETSDANNRRAVAITVASPNTIVACATFERDTAWRLSDQLVDASCSSSPPGADLEYSWKLGSGGTFGAFTGVPTIMHVASGSISVVAVQARDSGTVSPVDTLTDTLVVLFPRVAISGPTTITSTMPQTYTATSSPPVAPLPSNWYVRLPPDTTWTLISGPSPVTSIQYAWPPGCGAGYTAYLRADASTPTILKRFRLTVLVQTTQTC